MKQSSKLVANILEKTENIATDMKQLTDKC